MNQILTAAQSLPASERTQLIATLWDVDSVPPDPQWITEANRRSDAYDAGEMTGDSWADERARRETGLA